MFDLVVNRRIQMRKSILLLLLCAGPTWADSMNGTFVDQPVVYQGCHTCGFFPAGTIQEAHNGARLLLIDRRVTHGVTSTNTGDWREWAFIPFEWQWVTKANSWTLEGSDLQRVGGPEDWSAYSGAQWFSDSLLPYIDWNLNGSALNVTFYGYPIGSGTVTSVAVPEPGGWLLMLSVAGMALLSRGLRGLSREPGGSGRSRLAGLLHILDTSSQ